MSQASARARDVSDRANRNLERVGKIGYAAYGVVHVVLALLIVRLAFGGSSESASAGGALATLVQQPFGAVLVWTIALGMVLLTAWQVAEAFLDDGDGAKGRVQHAGKAVAYGAIAGVALRTVLSSGGGSGGGGEEKAAGLLFQLPGGRYLVGLVGVGILVIAGYHVYKGVSGKYRENLRMSELPDGTRRAVDLGGRIGYPAKGLAYAVVAVLFMIAAVQYDSEEAGGLDQALGALREQPFGPVVLVVVGLGFGLFAVFCFGRARTSPE